MNDGIMKAANLALAENRVDSLDWQIIKKCLPAGDEIEAAVKSAVVELAQSKTCPSWRKLRVLNGTFMSLVKLQAAVLAAKAQIATAVGAPLTNVQVNLDTGDIQVNGSPRKIRGARKVLELRAAPTEPANSISPDGPPETASMSRSDSLEPETEADCEP